MRRSVGGLKKRKIVDDGKKRRSVDGRKKRRSKGDVMRKLHVSSARKKIVKRLNKNVLKRRKTKD